MNVTVIGLGLIGGSVLKALNASGHQVTGYDTDPETREAAGAESFTTADSIGAAVEGRDLVVLAVPLPALPPIIDGLKDFPGLITDVTSVKGPVRDLSTSLPRFVGGHPMAGRETSGFAASEATLFTGCSWVLCLEPGETSLDDWRTLATLFTELAARVIPITAHEHDRAVAQVSHVPHLFATALSGQLRDNPLAGTLAAGSFRDGTRVAATRAELIAAMCGGNASAVGAELDRLISELHDVRLLLDAPDPVAALVPALRPAVDLRRAWPAEAGDVVELPIEFEPLLELGRAGGWVAAVNRETVEAIRPETDRNRS
ncbi:prephenate dehydrogenase [Actinoplanes sp. NPDC000266]